MIATQKYWKALMSTPPEVDVLPKSDGFSLKTETPGLWHPEGRVLRSTPGLRVM